MGQIGPNGGPKQTKQDQGGPNRTEMDEIRPNGN